MTTCRNIALFCILVPLTGTTSASFQVRTSTSTNKLVKHPNKKHEYSQTRASFTGCAGPLSALSSPSLDLSTMGDPRLGTSASVDSSDFLLSAGRTLEETANRISAYSAMLEEAARGVPALDATRKLSSYSTMIKEGTSSLDFDGALNGVKINLQSTTDVLQSTNDALNLGQLQNAKQAFDSVAGDPEKLLMSASQNLVDGIGQQLSSQDSVKEFWQWYVAALDERYHLSNFHQSVISGTALTNAMNKVVAVGETAVNALDIKHQGPIYLFLVAIFWASAQQGVGVASSDQSEIPKSVASEMLLSEQKIKDLEVELATTKAAAKKESQEKSNEIKELRQQMDTLQTQVVALTEAAAALTAQLEKASAPVAVTIDEPAEPSVVETPKDLGKTEKPSKVKGVQKTAASTSDTKQKTKSKTTKAGKTAKKSKKSAVKESVSEPALVSTPPPKAAEKRVKKTIVVSKADWKSLSEATLKRKTVKELTGYLTEKGVDVSDTDGKTLKKDSLVELVQTL